jgi:serine protease Do/serine protease DegQ
MVRAIMAQLIENGEVHRGYLGLAVQGLNAQLAEAFGVDRLDGVVVLDVEPDSPASAAGVRDGDIVTRVGNKEVRKISDFHSQAAVIFVGDEIELEILRDGKERRLQLEIGDNSQEKMPGERADRRLVGTYLQNFRSDGGAIGAGVLVTKVEVGSPPWKYGLRPGDVIVASNRVAVRNLTEFRDSARVSSEQLLLRVYRSGQFGYVAIR